MSETVGDTQLQWNTNKDMHKTYSSVISNDLEWPWMTYRNSQWYEARRALCDSWASCKNLATCIIQQLIQIAGVYVKLRL